jgi:hypothetical protein
MYSGIYSKRCDGVHLLSFLACITAFVESPFLPPFPPRSKWNAKVRSLETRAVGHPCNPLVTLLRSLKAKQGTGTTTNPSAALRDQAEESHWRPEGAHLLGVHSKVLDFVEWDGLVL